MNFCGALVCTMLSGGMLSIHLFNRLRRVRAFVFPLLLPSLLVLLLPVSVQAAYVDKADLTGDLIVELASDPAQDFVIQRDALYDMGVKTEAVYIPYLKKTIQCTVLPLAAILDAYPEFDAAFAYCYDGYMSYYTSEFIAEYDPYVVLDLEGNERGDMQLEGTPDMGPFYITFAKQLTAGSEEILDPANKRPFGVYKLKLGSQESLVGPLFEAPFDTMDANAQAGREIWMNNCMSCHSWDPVGPGGNLSNRIVKIVSMHAKYNKQYFHDFVKDPQVTMPDSKMPKHPHYSDETIEQIRQFLTHVPN
ncbi:cytochrome c [Coraliomargarita algicola]|uniref:Cytochrome c n=1 Tax=Coraliomargarita algicola TaxID=3092156 RepID=A0ABZ0RH59_9BACT|nr:cytochrome c [Coraliomargarita sp. J2-16]WPJ94584.1 cytochrome c [Coraliomargarita sp. J2-16]